MSSDFCGGFNARRAPIMSQGDKESVEESKVPDPSTVDASVSGGNNLHGDPGCGSVAQAITQIQRGDDDTQDWDAEVLNHVLAHVLDKNPDEAGATNDFTVFVIANGIDDVCLPLTMLEDDFQLMGYDINFKTFRNLQMLNKMCNKQVLDTMSEDDENLWFLSLSKRGVMRCIMRDTKVTTIPSANIIATPNVPLGRSNSNKAKLEMAQRLSLVMYNVGKLPLAPTPIASNVTRRVTFGPTTAATNTATTGTTAAPTAATMTPMAATMMVPVMMTLMAPTLTYVTSRALEFDKGG